VPYLRESHQPSGGFGALRRGENGSAPAADDGAAKAAKAVEVRRDSRSLYLSIYGKQPIRCPEPNSACVALDSSSAATAVAFATNRP
jgi:hypothetical protein